MTKKELANIAGYTYRRLYGIDRDLPQDKKLFVESGDGKYSLALFVQRWAEYNAGKAAGKKRDLEAVKAAHEEIKAEKTKLEVERMRGELVDVQDVRRLWGEIVNTATQSFLRMPGKLAPMLRMLEDTDEIAGIIDAETRQILEGIAETPVPDYAAAEETGGEA